VISNGVISGCEGGAIELKTGNMILDEDDHYEDMLITNVVMKMRGAGIGVKLNWTGPKANSGKRGRRIALSNNVIRHEHAGSPAGWAILVSAFSGVQLANNRIEGAATGIGIAPSGAADDTGRDIRITGNHLCDVQVGISATKGRVEQLELSGNTIDCSLHGITLCGAECRDVLIAHNRIRQRGGAPFATTCIQVRNARQVEIWSNHLDGESHNAVHVLDDSFGVTDGTIVRNVAVSAKEAPLRVDGGDWQVIDNVVRGPAHHHAVMAGPKAKVNAAWNVRGYAQGRPMQRGASGEVVLSTGRHAAPPGWWFDAEAENGRGIWQPFAPELEQDAGVFAAPTDAARATGNQSAIPTEAPADAVDGAAERGLPMDEASLDAGPTLDRSAMGRKATTAPSDP
jgi:hypothetical protein